MTQKKVCPNGKILNPKTNRCVNADGKIGLAIAATAHAPAPAVAPVAKDPECEAGKIFNPKTKRCVKVDGKIGKLLLAAKTTTQKTTPTKPSPRAQVLYDEQLVDLSKQLADAMKRRDMSAIIKLQKQIQEVKSNRDAQRQQVVIPEHLTPCLDVDRHLPKIPTVDGDEDALVLFKDGKAAEKRLYVSDGYCYDVVSLIKLIEVDITQGNIWGVNPYLKREGLTVPFPIGFKDDVLAFAKQHKSVSPKYSWRESLEKLRPYTPILVSCGYAATPIEWMKNGWASDGTAFPTSTYISIKVVFDPRMHLQVTPGKELIFPDTAEAKDFIAMQLIPSIAHGVIWTPKISATLGFMVLSPNVHFVFRDNMPERWYSNKVKNLAEEMQKYAPGFSQKPILDLNSSRPLRHPLGHTTIALEPKAKKELDEQFANEKKYFRMQAHLMDANGDLRETYVGPMRNSKSLNTMVIEYMLTGIPIAANQDHLSEDEKKRKQGFKLRAKSLLQSFKPADVELVIYHGSATRIHNSERHVKLLSFLSTTISTSVAKDYAGKHGYIYKMTLPVGYPCINCFDLYRQILLPMGAEIKIGAKNGNVYSCELVNSIDVTTEAYAKLFDCEPNEVRVADLSETIAHHTPMPASAAPVVQIPYRGSCFKDDIHLFHAIYQYKIEPWSLYSPMHMLSRAVNEMLCTLIYEFYGIRMTKSRVGIDPKALGQLCLVSKLSDYEGAGLRIHLPISQVIVDVITDNNIHYKNVRGELINVGDCLAYALAKKINIKFYTNSVNEQFVAMSRVHKSELNKNTIVKFMNAVKIDDLRSDPNILKLALALKTHHPYLSTFVTDVVEIVIKRHQYVVKHLDDLLAIAKQNNPPSMTTPTKGGAPNDQEEEAVLAIGVERARKLFDLRMQQGCVRRTTKT